MDNDCIIQYDDNGLPFIAHAKKERWHGYTAGQVLSKRMYKKSQSEPKKDKDYKYIHRIKLSNGHWRYFYGQKEWQAYLRRGKLK